MAEVVSAVLFGLFVFLFGAAISLLGVWLGQLLDTRRVGCLPYSVLRFMLWLVVAMSVRSVSI